GAHLLMGEHGARAAQPARHLIEDQQRAVARTAFAHSGPEPVRRTEDGGPADGLGNERGKVALAPEHVIYEVGEALEGAIRSEEALGKIERRNVLGSGQERADVATEDGLAADRNGVERRPVEGIP